MHERSAFLTLTYDDDNVPADWSLDVRHWQLFMKRLRHHSDSPIKFYHCGEYGDQTSRPHYHACIFGMDFDDKEHWRTQNGVRSYRSELLERTWGKGHCECGDVTFESAAYVARYIMKKVTGDEAEKHYEIVNLDTGEIHSRRPEYTTMSNGLGHKWWNTYQEETLRDDTIVMRGRAMQPPKAYDRLHARIWEQLEGPEGPKEKAERQRREGIQDARARKARAHAEDNTPDRLRTRETVKKAQLRTLKRTIQ